MQYLALQQHRAEDCPGRNPKHIKEMSDMLSRKSLASKGLQFVDAYIDHACMVQSKGEDHTCAFLLEGDTSETVAEAFAPFRVEVKPVVGWGKYLGKE